MLTMTSALLSPDTTAPSTRCFTAVRVSTLGLDLKTQEARDVRNRRTGTHMKVGNTSNAFAKQTEFEQR